MPTTIANMGGGHMQIRIIAAVIAVRILCAFGVIGILFVIADRQGIVGMCGGFSVMLCAGAYVYRTRYEVSVVTTMYATAVVAAALGFYALISGHPVYAQAELFGFASAVLFMLPFVVRKKRKRDPGDETSEG